MFSPKDGATEFDTIIVVGWTFCLKNDQYCR